MINATDLHILRMSCQTANAIDRFWEITVPCLITIGVLINGVICIDMISQRIVTKNFANFFVFHLSLVDIIFRLSTIAPWIMLRSTDSTEQSGPACKVLYVCNAMCGAAFFSTLALISGYVYRNLTSPLRGMESLSRVWVARAVTFVWVYAVASSCLLIASACSVRYTELPEVAPQMTEGLQNCSVPKLCDLQRDWSGQSSSTVYFTMGFCVPMFIIIALSVKMHINHKQIKQEQNIECQSQFTQYKAHENVVRMLVVLSIVVAVSWGPTSVIFMVRSYGHRVEQLSSDAVLGILITAEILKFFNSLPNPLIFYCFIPNYRWCRFLRTWWKSKRSAMGRDPPKNYEATSIILNPEFETMW